MIHLCPVGMGLESAAISIPIEGRANVNVLAYYMPKGSSWAPKPLFARPVRATLSDGSFPVFTGGSCGELYIFSTWKGQPQTFHGMLQKWVGENLKNTDVTHLLILVRKQRVYPCLNLSEMDKDASTFEGGVDVASHRTPYLRATGFLGGEPKCTLEHELVFGAVGSTCWEDISVALRLCEEKVPLFITKE